MHLSLRYISAPHDTDSPSACGKSGSERAGRAHLGDTLFNTQRTFSTQKQRRKCRAVIEKRRFCVNDFARLT